jgi:putative transposase
MKKRYTGEQIIKAIKAHEAGAKVDDLCRQLGISSGTFYNWRRKYAGLEVNEAKRLRELEQENGKLKKLVKNKKRTYRIYREEALQVRTKSRKKLQRPRLPMVVPTRVNERWSMDFVSDQLSCGRRFRVLNVIDDYNREMIGQLVSVSISGRQVARFLSELIDRRGQPETVVCDNGTEFTSKAMFFWSGDTGVKLGFIQPSKPTQNALVESLNGKFREECLSVNWFRSLEEARVAIAEWRDHYNTVRQHSSLNYLPPVEFARQAA